MPWGNVSVVKCHMGDTGLLLAMAFSGVGSMIPEVYRQVLLGDEGVNEGILAENTAFGFGLLVGETRQFDSWAFWAFEFLWSWESS